MKRYNIIYADPPWRYNDKLQHYGGGAESHYSTMSQHDLCSLEIDTITGKDCALFMWATWPQLVVAVSVIEAWGFVYKTCAFVWIKTNKRLPVGQTSFLPQDMFDDFMGLGRWTRGNTEFCLFATTGKPQRQSNAVRQIVYSPVGRHSSKPNEVRSRIVDLCGDLPRIELFAREPTDGWDVWGNEVDSDITIKKIPEGEKH